MRLADTAVFNRGRFVRRESLGVGVQRPSPQRIKVHQVADAVEAFGAVAGVVDAFCRQDRRLTVDRRLTDCSA